MALDKTIKTLRTERGWTQDALSRKIGISPKMISFYELGERKPSRDTLIKLAEVFGIPLDRLVNYDAEREEKEPTRVNKLAEDIKEILITTGAFGEDTILTQEEYSEWLKFMRAQAIAYRELKK